MGDTIDKVLGIGASFDWISPLASVLGDLAHGGGYTFTFPACHMTPVEVEKLLRARGITTWGLMHTAGTTMLSVRKQDAARAYSILNQAGVPIENPPPPPRRAQKAQGRARQGGVFSMFDDIFER